MGALPRPDLAPGPARELNDALHELHHRAGWPSLRTLAGDAGCSHTTVSHVFSSARLPTWGVVELLVEAMHGTTSSFHDLWLAASAPSSNGSSPPPRIAGRHSELIAVRRHLETGNGLLLVTGEAGIGKTKLVTTAIEQARVHVAVGHCLPLSIEAPLMPIGVALRNLLTSDDGRRMKSALADCPVFVTHELARLLPELDSGSETITPDDFGRQRLFTAVGLALAALAKEGPLALCFEDLHWADPSTLDVLEHLCTGQVPDGVALMGTWRDDDPATSRTNVEWRTRAGRVPGTTTIRLVPLSREETRVQLTALGRADELDAVFSRSRGHPLFTRHLAAHLPEPGLPLALADLLDARLRDIDGAAWKVARTLGVADRPLPAGLIASVAGLQDDQVAVALRSLDEHSLLGRSADPDADPDQVGLAHPLLAEAARRRLVPGEGSGVHRELARALATLDDPAPAEIARHWQLAGDPAQEIVWLVAAARDAASRFDWIQEADHWVRVVDLWPGSAAQVGDPPITRIGAHLAAIDALDESRQWHRAADLSLATEALLPDLDDLERAEVLRRAAEYRCERDGLQAGLTLVEEALDLFGRRSPSRGLLRAMSHKRWLLMSLGHYQEAHTLAREAAEIAQGLEHRPATRSYLATLAWHEGLEHGPQAAMVLLERGHDMFADGSDPLGDVRQSLLATDIHLLCASGLDEVEAAGRVGIEVSEKWGIDNMVALMVRANVATARLQAGMVSEAAELIAIDANAVPDPDRWPLHAVRAVIDTMTGHPAHGVERLTSMWGEVVVDGEIDLEELAVLTQLHFWNGTARTPLERLLRDLDAVVDQAPARVLCPALLEATRAVAETEAAGRSYRATIHDLCARAALSKIDDVGVAAHARTITAELARLDAADRVDHWTNASALWDRVHRPHDAAYCRWRAAQVALRDGQGTVAARLLKRAATDARQHVPLLTAIRATGAHLPAPSST